MPKTVVRVEKQKAIALFVFCGWKSSGRWDLEKMQAKLSDVREVLPANKDPEEDLKATIEEVLKGIDEKAEFEVYEEPVLGEEGDSEVSEGGNDGGGGEAEAAASDTPKAEAEEEKKDKPAAAKTPRAPSAPKAKLSRTYCAGVVLKKHGLDAPITEAMAKEVDDLCGTPNLKESLSWLKIGWHVANGFTEHSVPG